MLAGGGIVVALSGGADSRALLHALIKICGEGTPVMCAHVNHMLRGAEADRDEEFCRSICNAEGIPLRVLRVDVAQIARREGKGFEEAARDVRYAFFHRILEENAEFKKIATAHTASDNGETVLFNLMRGGGIKGLCGIPPVRGRIIRPLIYVTREEILDYCRENSLEYVTDSTNADTAYSRNYIRAEIMPRLDKLYGNAADAISRASRNLRRDSDYLETEAERVFGQLYAGHLPTRELRALHPAVLARVVALAYGKITEKRAESVHLDSVCNMIYKKEEPFSLYLPDDVVCRCERGKLFFEKAEEKADTAYRTELSVGENILPSGAILLVLPAEEAKNIQKSQNVYNLSIFARVSGDTIEKGIFARSRENGDSYRFGNMTRKLKKLLCDRGIPLWEREVLPVVCDKEGILWVPGFGVRDGAAGKDSEKDYIIYYIKAQTA